MGTTQEKFDSSTHLSEVSIETKLFNTIGTFHLTYKKAFAYVQKLDLTR